MKKPDEEVKNPGHSTMAGVLGLEPGISYNGRELG